MRKDGAIRLEVSLRSLLKAVHLESAVMFQFDRKLDGKLAGAMMSINAFKGVEVGLGFEMARKPGSEVHDEIAWDEEQGYYRKSNRLGDFEGGVSNGMPIVIRGVMKPIPTLYKPLGSVDIRNERTFCGND